MDTSVPTTPQQPQAQTVFPPEPVVPPQVPSEPVQYSSPMPVFTSDPVAQSEPVVQPAPVFQPEPASEPPEETVIQQPPASSAPPASSTAPADSNTYFPDYMKPVQEEELFVWPAPSRPFKKHNRRYFTTVVTIALLISMILFFAGQFLPIAVVVAVAFLAYVMATIPPHEVTHKITTFGIRLEDQLYYWEELGRFWFTKRYGQDLVNIEVTRFPNRLTIVLGEMTLDDMRLILQEVLLEQAPAPTYYERVAAWIQEKIPLDVD